ncbi:unnamed protein product, partial [Medioppia subpectinata]
MSVEIIAENNRLIRELLFAKKLIKCLENIMHFAVNMKTTCGCDHIRTLIHTNDHHFHDYQRIRKDMDESISTVSSAPVTATPPIGLAAAVVDTGCQTTTDDASDNIPPQPITTGRKTTEITRICDNCHQVIARDCLMTAADDLKYDSNIYAKLVATEVLVMGTAAEESLSYPLKPKTGSKKCLSSAVAKTTVENYCLMTALPMPLKCFGCDRMYTKCEDFLDHINRGNQLKQFANKSTETAENQENRRPLTGSAGDQNSPKIPIETCAEGYRCGYKGCSYTTKNRKHVVFHFTAHKTYRPYRCVADGCRQWFKTDAHLRSHQMVVHPDEFPDRQWFRCPSQRCDYKTKVNSALTKHMRCHTGPEAQAVRYQCADCDKSYARQRTLDEHRSVVHTRALEYRCSQCDKRYNCLSALKTHVKQTHYKQFVCDTCAQKFVSDMELRAHTLGLHSSGNDESLLITADDVDGAAIAAQLVTAGETMTSKAAKLSANDIPIYPSDGGYRCGYAGCAYTAKRDTQVFKHTVTHSSARPYRCRLDGCKVRFKTESVLNGHQINCHPDSFPDRQWLTCPADGCPYRTKGNANIARHIRTHTHRYACDACDKTYATRLSLRDHQRSVHPSGDGQHPQRVYGCDQCPKTYAVARKLRAHRQQCHNRVYACDYHGCDRQFGVQSHLQLHRQRVHDKSYVRPVACDWKGCDHRFDCLSKMREHMN